MISGFGVDHGVNVAKATKRDKHGASGAAIAGGGAVTAGLGLVGGGIPGTRSNADKLAAWKASGANKGGKTRQKASTARAKAPMARAFPGGIFGYRTDAHVKYSRRTARKEAHFASKTPTSKLSHGDAFNRGHTAGKLPPEEQVIRHLKTGRKAATVALIGGTAATAYGINRMQGKRKRVAKAQRQTEKYHGALLGGGATAAGLSHGAYKITSSQQRKWVSRAAQSSKAAEKIAPKLKGVMDEDVPSQARKIFRGKTREQAEAAGKHSGAAAQQRYFGKIYGAHAKVFRGTRYGALGVAAIGAGGLGASRMKNKR